MFIDERIKHVGVSTLRKIDADVLRELDDTLYVLRDHDEPVAVLLSYKLFLKMQDMATAARKDGV